MKANPKRKIGEMLTRVKDDVQIDDFTTYGRITIRMAGKGVTLRDRVIGSEIGTKRQFIARTGQFVLSKIDARNGAFGVLPDDCNNAIVTGNFWVFDVDHSQLDSRFFNYLSKSPGFVAACVAASDGTTNRRYLQEDAFLDMVVPTPDLTTQQALVSRLDALTEKTRQVEAHLDAVERDAEHLLALRFRDAIADAPLRPMADVAPFVRRSVEIDIQIRYREVGARSFGKGLFIKPDFDGAEATWQKPVWIKSGDLVLSNIKAWEGAIAIAGEEHDGCIASHRYITCVPDYERATVGFLAYYLLSEDGLEKVGLASPGTADRNRTLSLGNLSKIEVPAPPLVVQQAFNRLQAEIAALKAKHIAIREANAALLPATLERVFKQ